MRDAMVANAGLSQTDRPLAPISAAFASKAIVPPPVATTTSGSARVPRSASASICRKAGSPCASKICRTVIPARRSISSSRSTNCTPSRRASRRPTVVLPHPMNPVR